MTDKAYDTDAPRRSLTERGAEAVIPSTASRKAPIAHDRDAYRQRNLIKLMFCRLKDFRRVATDTTSCPATSLPPCTSPPSHLLAQLSPGP